MPNQGTARGTALPRRNARRGSSPSPATLLRSVRRAGASIRLVRKISASARRRSADAFCSARERIPESPRRAQKSFDRTETEQIARRDGRRLVRDHGKAVDAGEVLAARVGDVEGALGVGLEPRM